MGAQVNELTLPFPPSANRLYRRVGPRTLISREGRRYRETVCALLAAAGVRPLFGPIAVQIDYFPPDRRVRDLDNLQKGLLDALQHGGAFENDSQIKELHTRMGKPILGGKCLVWMREIRES